MKQFNYILLLVSFVLSANGTLLSQKKLDVEGSAVVSDSLGIGTDQIEYNLTFGNSNSIVVGVLEQPDNIENGKSLTIKAGNASRRGVPFLAKRGGDLILEAGNGYNSNIPGADGGDVIIRSGGNHLASTGNGVDGGSIIMSTGGPNRTFVERVRIVEGGFVGIGTTNPTEKLEVDGNIKASGSIEGLNTPLAWGRFRPDGSMSPSSFGVSGVVRNSVGNYSVTLSSNWSSQPIITATVFNNTVTFINTFASSNTNVFGVSTYDLAGNFKDDQISFVVYGTKL